MADAQLPVLRARPSELTDRALVVGDPDRAEACAPGESSSRTGTWPKTVPRSRWKKTHITRTATWSERAQQQC
jgi:uridine phosphorylase